MWSSVAVYRPTGTVTSPNVITPVQIARAIPLLRPGHPASPGTTAGAARPASTLAPPTPPRPPGGQVRHPNGSAPAPGIRGPTTKSRRGTTTTKTTTSETSSKGRSKFHTHDQHIAGDGPVNGQ